MALIKRTGGVDGIERGKHVEPQPKVDEFEGVGIAT